MLGEVGGPPDHVRSPPDVLDIWREQGEQARYLPTECRSTSAEPALPQSPGNSGTMDAVAAPHRQQAVVAGVHDGVDSPRHGGDAGLPALSAKLISGERAEVTLSCMSSSSGEVEKKSDRTNQGQCAHELADGSKTANKRFGNKFGSCSKCMTCGRWRKFDSKIGKWLVVDPPS